MRIRALAVVIAVVGCTVAADGQETSREVDIPSLRDALVEATTPGRQLAVLTPCFAGFTSCGQTATGRVSVDSCVTSSGVYGVGYAFNGTQGATVTISGRSPTFAATIALGDGREGQSRIYAQADVFQAGQTATIANFTLPYTGTYLIIITPGTPYTFGDYTLSITCSSSTTCSPSSTNLCLSSNRFRVSVTWRTSTTSGHGTAVPMTSDTGHFWFFSSSNVELIVKVLDGRPVNGRFWVFYGALSDVEYTITVRDTISGATKTYFNPAGRMASVGDTTAF